MRILDRIWSVIDLVIKYLMAICFGGMTLIIFLQVVSRYVLKSPLSWSEELARYLFVWVSYIGSVIAARQGQHIGVELLIKKFPSRCNQIIRIIANVLTGCFFLVVFIYFCKMWPMLSMQKTSALQLPMSYPYLGLGIGSILLAFTYLTDAIRVFSEKKEA